MTNEHLKILISIGRMAPGHYLDALIYLAPLNLSCSKIRTFCYLKMPLRSSKMAKDMLKCILTLTCYLKFIFFYFVFVLFYIFKKII